MMRTVFFLLTLLSLALARRMPSSTTSNPVDVQRLTNSRWGYPYGWGMDMPMSTADNMQEENHKAVKEVKNEKKVMKKDEKEHERHNPFLWGVHHVSEVEDMDGLE